MFRFHHFFWSVLVGGTAQTFAKLMGGGGFKAWGVDGWVGGEKGLVIGWVGGIRQTWMRLLRDILGRTFVLMLSADALWSAVASVTRAFV